MGPNVTLLIPLVQKGVLWGLNLVGLEAPTLGIEIGWSRSIKFGDEIWLVEQILSFTSIINKFTYY